MKEGIVDLQPALAARPFLLEPGESEIMDMKVRDLLPLWSASNISVPSLNKQNLVGLFQEEVQL